MPGARGAEETGGSGGSGGARGGPTPPPRRLAGTRRSSIALGCPGPTRPRARGAALSRDFRKRAAPAAAAPGGRSYHGNREAPGRARGKEAGGAARWVPEAMGRITGLVPSRFLTLLAHLVVVMTLFWSRVRRGRAGGQGRAGRAPSASPPAEDPAQLGPPPPRGPVPPTRALPDLSPRPSPSF